jgi:AcrR family transcriptional regulator
MNVHSHRRWTKIDMTEAIPVPVADQRTAEILDSARRAFAEKGFDGASMQDIARKAGMSVGNFYRYFPSKDAIVEALINVDIAEMEQDFRVIRLAPNPMAALRETIEQRISSVGCNGDGQLWAEITAAALRKPEIGHVACKMEDDVVNHLTAVFAIATGVAHETALARWRTQAQFLVMLVKACAMQKPDAPNTSDLKQLVMRTIHQTLDEISQSAAKG